MQHAHAHTHQHTAPFHIRTNRFSVRLLTCLTEYVSVVHSGVVRPLVSLCALTETSLWLTLTVRVREYYTRLFPQ